MNKNYFVQKGKIMDLQTVTMILLIAISAIQSYRISKLEKRLEA